jgi:metal-responsive CopG/Arc/MetJ family transcriptional regulator
MKLAISVPESVVAKAELLAHRLGTSRSAIFAKALHAYEPESSENWLTESANLYADEMTQDMREEQEAWVKASSSTAAKNTEWK